jgi:adenylosuccinate synthase
LKRSNTTVGKLDKIKLCVAYSIDGKKEEYFTTNTEVLSKAKPIYEEFEGNFGDISNCKTYEELPENAKKYVERIEELTNTQVKFIGTGAGRENIIIR